MLKDYFQQLQLQQHRGLLVLSGTPEATRNLAKYFVQQNCDNSGCLWLGEGEPVTEKIRYSQVSHSQHYLGTESCVLIYDAHCGFSPNAFCAAADTVAGGGVILLLSPPLDEWPNSRDENFSTAYQVEYSPQRFIQRLVKYLLNAQQQKSFLRIIDAENGQELKSLKTIFNTSHSSDTFLPTEAQTDIVKQILRAIHGRAHRPLVINAARGRGKSTALGMALAEWVRAGNAGRIILSGPGRNAVFTAFNCAEKQLDVQVNTDQLCVGNAVVTYFPIDKILGEQPAADVLVIDEAAAIPLPILQQLLQQYQRIIFITTTIGYEGSGRGFVLRFSRLLDNYSSQWRRATLNQPIRWATDDPMEKWLYECFLLADQSKPESNLSGILHSESVKHCLLSRDDLIADELLLSDVFRLLVNAHYRTEPDDLRYLLDVPNVKIWASFCGERIVAAALIAEESALSIEVFERIRMQIHRPRGHVLSQTLALQEGIYDALRLNAWRVVRIAVQPEFQRSGLGTALLNNIINSAQNSGIDYIGSSFSVDTKVFAFWLSSGFSLLRIGLHRDHITASYSALVIEPFSDAAKNLQHVMQMRFVQKLPRLLSSYWRDMDSQLVVQLFKRLPAEKDCSPIDVQQLGDYLRAATSYDSAWLSLSSLLIWRLSSGSSQDNITELPVRRILQCWSWDELTITGKYSGRNAIEKQLRDNLMELFADVLPELSLR